MLKHLKAILMIAVIGLTGCSSQPEPPIKLIANSWIGYSPLFYAKEKGWLKPLNIELSTVVSLGESMMTFKLGNFNGLTGTQYEFQQLQKHKASLNQIEWLNSELSDVLVEKLNHISFPTRDLL